MRLRKLLSLAVVPFAAAQYLNSSTTTLEPIDAVSNVDPQGSVTQESSTQNSPQEQHEPSLSTFYSTVTNEIVNTVYITLDNNQVSTQLSTLTTDQVAAFISTVSETHVIDPTTVTDDSTSTTTVTIYYTISSDGGSTASLDAVNAGVEQVYADDITSTLTTTKVQTLTLTNSAGVATGTVVSSLEKQVLLGDFSCVPDTVTVTQYETTKYITIDSSKATQAEQAEDAASSAGGTVDPTSAYYSNSTIAA